MAGYIGFPIETDPKVFVRNAFDYLQGLIPGWSPSDGNLDVWIVEAAAQMVAEERDVASAMPLAVFRYFGKSILRLLPIDGSAATATTTWTMINDDGYTIPAGTIVGIRRAGDVIIPFRVFNTTIVGPGQTSTAEGEVLIQAINIGEEANAVGSIPNGPVELIDTLAFVSTVVQETLPTGGEDRETDEEYMDRLADELTLLSPVPILPDDFATLARRIPGVERALALDMYDPDLDQDGVERTVTIVAIDVFGNAVSGAIKTQIKDYLESLRELNFVVKTMDPTYTEIDVTFTATAQPGHNPATVDAAATAALEAYLDPRFWGLPPQVDLGDAAPGQWINDTTIRFYEIVAVLDRVVGLDHVVTVTIGDGGPQGTSNIVMTGRATLPLPGTIVGTVT